MNGISRLMIENGYFSVSMPEPVFGLKHLAFAAVNFAMICLSGMQQSGATLRRRHSPTSDSVMSSAVRTVPPLCWIDCGLLTLPAISGRAGLRRLSLSHKS